MKDKICTLIASRGLIHSRTVECILDNFEDFEAYEGDYHILFSHNRPIPDAQNYLVEEALKTDCTHFWFVEEDMVFPKDTLFKLVAEQMPVVAVDYPVGEKKFSTINVKDGEIRWCGLGCTMIDRIVFEEMKKPWFRIDKSWRVTDVESMDIVEDKNPYKYGGHDINFGMECKRLGIPIVALKGVVAGHLRIVDSPNRESNNGAFHVVEYNTIRNYQRY